MTAHGHLVMSAACQGAGLRRSRVDDAGEQIGGSFGGEVEPFGRATE